MAGWLLRLPSGAMLHPDAGGRSAPVCHLHHLIELPESAAGECICAVNWRIGLGFKICLVHAHSVNPLSLFALLGHLCGYGVGWTRL